MSVTASESRFEQKVRKKALASLGNEQAQQQARRASLTLSQQLIQTSNNNKNSNSLLPVAIDPFLFLETNTSDPDTCVAASAIHNNNDVRAIQRGSSRGQSESNELELLNEDDLSDLDVTTAHTDFTNTEQQHTQNKKKLPTKKRFQYGKKAKSSKYSVASSSTTSRSVNNNKKNEPAKAWMCGVCGKAFASLQVANQHEDWHVRSVVANLKWAQPTTVHQTDDRARLLTEESYDSSGAHVRWQGTGRKLATVSETHDDAPLSARWEGQDRHNSNIGKDVPIHSQSLATMSEKKKQPNNNKLEYDAATSQPDSTKVDSLTGLQVQQDYLALADQALVHVCEKAIPWILSPQEVQAELQLQWLARDKSYYDDLNQRALARRKDPTNRFRREGEALLDQVHNKLLDAYQIMKQGDCRNGALAVDQYMKRDTANGAAAAKSMMHSTNTLYVNVMVKNSVQVVRHELERLAQQKWERSDDAPETFTRFERFRVYAHMNIVKLAGLALQSDFTPRRIAVQLSNDLYRLLTPRLRRRGIAIETEIEYRIGGYFVLAVNIHSIDWIKLMKANRRDILERKSRWEKEQLKHVAHEEKDEKAKQFLLKRWYHSIRQLFALSYFDVIAKCLALLYYFHWTISIPICFLAYHSPWGSAIRVFTLSSVTDEIFYYVEEKGMEMDIRVRQAYNQTSFMLSALREIRAEGREFKKKQQETESLELGVILGPLLGPAIKADKEAPTPLPPGFVIPESLEFVGLELDLPVGFRRLRWAFLSDESSFMTEAVFKTESKYENITQGAWNKHCEHIGSASLPNGVSFEDFVGAERESSYLMPKSAFVAANMCYQSAYLIAYNDNCFCIKQRAKTPDVPFGSTFFCWTMIMVENLGGNSCKMTCSVEAEFPNGPPMIARQIQSGMRAGTAELFVVMGETVTKYAEAFP